MSVNAEAWPDKDSCVGVLENIMHPRLGKSGLSKTLASVARRVTRGGGLIDKVKCFFDQVIKELNSIYSLQSHPLTLAAIFETTKRW